MQFSYLFYEKKDQKIVTCYSDDRPLIPVCEVKTGKYKPHLATTGSQCPLDQGEVSSSLSCADE